MQREIKYLISQCFQPSAVCATRAGREAQLAGVSMNFSGDHKQEGSGGSLGAEAQRGLLSNDQRNKFPLLDVGASPSTVTVSLGCGCGCTLHRDVSGVYREIKMR